jgi:hypothetical protein
LWLLPRGLREDFGDKKRYVYLPVEAGISLSEVSQNSWLNELNYQFQSFVGFSSIRDHSRTTSHDFHQGPICSCPEDRGVVPANNTLDRLDESPRWISSFPQVISDCIFYSLRIVPKRISVLQVLRQRRMFLDIQAHVIS